MNTITFKLLRSIIVITTLTINLQSQVPYFETTLPIIFVNTNGSNIVDEPKISANMGIIYHGNDTINKTTDSFNHYNGKIGIEIRGSSSQLYPKKSYSVETRDAYGNDMDVSLIGLPSESDWVFYGPYFDKSLIRNALAYGLSRKLGHYAPRTKFFELIINNDYKGIYLLVEKIKRSDNRLGISKLKNTDNSGDELTGGYIFKIDRITGSETEGWYSNYPAEGMSGAGLYYQFHYPSQSNITTEQRQYIKNWISDFENVMDSDFKYDANIGYYRLLDMNNAVDYFIVNEVCKNYDANAASFFLYKDKDSKDNKLHLGPVWDFNISMGNADDESFRSPNGWIADLYNHPWGQPLGRPFWSRLIWNDNTFWSSFQYRMRMLRSTYLSYGSLSASINGMIDEISGAIDRNFDRWPELGKATNTFNQLSGNQYANATHDSEIHNLKQWWSDRLRWIDSVVGSPLSSDVTPPEIPKNLTATSENGYVMLSWDANSDADIFSYTLFKGTQYYGWMDLLATVDKNVTTFVDSIIEENTTYFYQISAQDNVGNQSHRSIPTSTTTLEIQEFSTSDESLISQNKPNPFNSITTFNVDLPSDYSAKLTICDLKGKMIKEYKNLQGSQIITWDGKDVNGNMVGTGLYIYSVIFDDRVITKKMLLLK